MNYQIINLQDETVRFTGIACDLREWLEVLFEIKFGFCPMLQESEDDDCLEVYLHTDTYEDLSDEELTKLDDLGLQSLIPSKSSVSCLTFKLSN